ncbi:MAG: zinc-binding dehydrogenase [Okeania sp. SIO3B3]|nr:zinc-binding dehydrogenase [Okeania sp. SIO3B3]
MEDSEGTINTFMDIHIFNVNNTDINTRTGWYAADEGFQEILQDTKKNDEEKSTGWSHTGIKFPRIQGADIVGEVVEIGADVEPKFLNQRVIVDPWVRGENQEKYQYQDLRRITISSRGVNDSYAQAFGRSPLQMVYNLTFCVSPEYVGSELNGGFAEYVAIPVANVCPINSSLSDAELATVPCSYSTAENLLTKARVSDKDTVLIMGASGGVGSSAVQLAKIRGATVIAIVGKNKEHLVKELGADYIYPRNDELASNLAKHQITVSLDVVGGEYFEIIFKALSLGGRYVTAGAIASPIVDLDLRDLIYKDTEMIGATRVVVHRMVE